MIRKGFGILIAFIAILGLAACAQPMAAPAATMPAVEMEAAPMEPEFAEEAFARDTANSVIQSGQAQERLIIREGNLDIVVEDSETAAADIGRLAEVKGGWVVTTELYQSNGAKAGNVTIRVPAEEFDATVATIREMAVEVRSESSNSQDVTEEYVDLEARVANLEATADRVRNFLDEARNVEEALAVNQELSRLEGDIESLKARMNFLSQSAAMSRLTVYLTPDELSQPIEVGGWRPQGIARDAIDALIAAFQSLASVAIWGVIFCLPILLIIGLPLFFIGRFGYRRYQRRRATKTGVAEDTAGAEPDSATELDSATEPDSVTEPLEEPAAEAEADD